MAYSNGSIPFLVEIIIVAYMQTDRTGGYPFVGPAFDTGLADLSIAYPTIRFIPRVIYSDPYRTCEEWATESDNRVAQFYYRDHHQMTTSPPNLTVFLLAGCTELAGISKLGTGLNKLVLSTGGTTAYIFDKINFPSLLTTTFLSNTMIQTIYQRLLVLYKWTSVMMLVDLTGNLGSSTVAQSVQNAILRSSLAITSSYRTGNISSIEDMSPLLDHFQVTSRVMLVFGGTSSIRNFMRQIAQRNMTDGSYIFVAYSPLPSYGKTKDNRFNFTSENDEAIRRACRAMLFVEMDPDVVHVRTNLIPLWKEISRTKYNYTYDVGEQVSPMVPSAYAATSILGQVVHEVINQSLDFNWNNGGELTKRFLNRTFTTKIGPITLSSVGERLTMMRYSYFDIDKDQFEVALVQGASLDSNLQIIQTPTWPGPWPVPNEPRCGFRGDHSSCQANREHFQILVAGTGSGVVLILVAMCIAGQRYIFWRQLNDHWWLLKKVDLPAVVTQPPDRMYKAENANKRRRKNEHFDNTQKLW